MESSDRKRRSNASCTSSINGGGDPESRVVSGRSRHHETKCLCTSIRAADTTQSTCHDNCEVPRRVFQILSTGLVRCARSRSRLIHKEVHGSMQCSICGVSHLSFHISSSLVKTIHTINIAFRSPVLETGKALQTFCTFW